MEMGERQQMTNAQGSEIEIFEPAGGGSGRHTYVVTAMRGGEPAAGVDIKIAMNGAGSMAPSMSSAEIHRDTDASGNARFTWYRRSIFSRDVKATLVITASD